MSLCQMEEPWNIIVINLDKKLIMLHPPMQFMLHSGIDFHSSWGAYYDKKYFQLQEKC